MTGGEYIRELAVSLRQRVRDGSHDASESPAQGWTIMAGQGGVRWATPEGVVGMPDAWLDGDAEPEGKLAELLRRVEVIQ